MSRPILFVARSTIPAVPLVRGELFELTDDPTSGERRQLAGPDLVRFLRAEKITSVTLHDARQLLAGRPFVGTLLSRVRRGAVLLVEVAR